MILVVGDAMLDRYYWGDVLRISPEAPVPVVRVGRIEERPGAAANVAANCEAMGISCLRVYSPSKEQVVKIRVIGKNQQVVRIDFDHPQEPVLVADFEEKLKRADVVVFSDYAKGALANVTELILRAKESGKTVLVDPKGHDYTRYRGADVVKPNRDEMKEMLGGWGTEEKLAEKAETLRREAGIGAILLTRAEEGMTLFTAQGALNIPARAVEVFDVSGAGDTAIAAMAVAISMGYGLEEAARCANKAAGIVIQKFGTSIASRDEVFGPRRKLRGVGDGDFGVE